MATLLDVHQARQHVLRSVHLVGRGPLCQLRLSSPLVSSTHAQMRWTGARWEIHDLDSCNGTFVNGDRLGHGEHVALVAGMHLAFGQTSELFTLVDDSPPMAHATSQQGQRREAEDHMFVLPDPECYDCTVFEENGSWLIETSASGERSPAHDGDVLSIGQDVWTLHLPLVVEPTWRGNAVPLLLLDIALRFAVDRTGEHIGLTILHRTGLIELTPRVHMEMLLCLAEARLTDQRDHGLASEDAGWIDVSTLLARLGNPDDAVSRNALCQQIYQARRQLLDAGVTGAMDIIQRRDMIATEGSRRVGQIRIGVRQLEIQRSRGTE